MLPLTNSQKKFSKLRCEKFSRHKGTKLKIATSYFKSTFHIIAGKPVRIDFQKSFTCRFTALPAKILLR
jgi:hypothetical protein